MEKKMITVMIPCYNEENNVIPMSECLTNIMEQLSDKYDYELIFRDNCSTDDTLVKLRSVARSDKHIKVISNSRNYGMDPMKNTFMGRVKGDVLISIACDFQEPPEKIPEFISWWEKGYEIVAAQKVSSKEGKFKYGLRQLYYKIIAKFSDTPQIKNMSGITLMSRRIADLYWNINSDQYFRYFVSDLGCEVKLIQYEQQKRRSGKSSYNVWKSLSFAISSLISTSVAPLRIATVCGVIFSFVFFLLGVLYLVFKLIFWDRFAAGTAPLLIGLFFIGSVLLFFIGIVGEYVGTILKKVTPVNPPLVKELINFDDVENDGLFFESVDVEKRF